MKIRNSAALLCALTMTTGTFAAEPAATASVTVDMKAGLGPIRLMNAVNNGPAFAPVLGDQKRGNFEEYRAARIPFARTHDSINCVSGGAHCCDVTAVFPNFDADENESGNYDFVFTDHYLDCIIRAGTKVFYRLGQTIEHGPKKYGVLPPKDFAKWARICEHIIRHYNEGWAWGLDTAPTTKNVAWSNQFDIAYWEIWNEPDLDGFEDASQNLSPRNWGGSVTNFLEFYETAAKHLKSRFPNLKIGGPALCCNEDFAERMVRWCREREVPLDFFSFHCYSRTPGVLAEKSERMRKLLDRYGFTKTETILNEWNYVKGWRDDWVYSLRAESGDLNLKGATYIAGAMVACQCSPLDMLMFYDARANCTMNNLFDKTTLWPMKGYYPYLAWAKLVDLGTQVGCRIAEGLAADTGAVTGFVEKQDSAVPGGFSAVAAKSQDGRHGALFIVRYSDDDNSSEIGQVAVRVPGCSLAGARCLVTDAIRSHTEVPLLRAPDGAVLIKMMPLSFALVEW